MRLLTLVQVGRNNYVLSEISSRRQTTSMGKGFNSLFYSYWGLITCHKTNCLDSFLLGLAVLWPCRPFRRECSRPSVCPFALCDHTFCTIHLLGKEVDLSPNCFRILLVYLALLFGSHDLWNNKCHLMLCAILNSLSGFRSG